MHGGQPLILVPQQPPQPQQTPRPLLLRWCSLLPRRILDVAALAGHTFRISEPPLLRNRRLGRQHVLGAGRPCFKIPETFPTPFGGLGSQGSRAPDCPAPGAVWEEPSASIYPRILSTLSSCRRKCRAIFKTAIFIKYFTILQKQPWPKNSHFLAKKLPVISI